jgi:regulator of protease activity HflC (stomatin/prohibitin superfamily)
VDFLSKPRTWVVLGVSAVGLFLLYQLWVWEVERVEVKPDEFLVRINLWGKNLPEDEIIAPDPSYKGVQRELLPEGRHFLNPILHTYERGKMLVVPTGQCAVLTRKSGKQISPERLARGEFLAAGDFDETNQEVKERGILEKVLMPTSYRINPYEYSYELVPMVQVKSYQVGVRTLKWGKDPRELKNRTNAYVVPDGYRGVQEKVLPPRDYYINPYVESIVPVDVRSHPVEFTDIEFPSRDGFLIKPHVLVSYRVIPEKAPELFVVLADDGVLHQEDKTPEEQKKNEILQKFVLPLIRGYVRTEGSNYDARSYISHKRTEEGGVNPREQLQRELMKKVEPECKKVGVQIEYISVTKIETTKELAELADQIADRERQRVMRLTNKQLVEQAKKEQEQKATEALKERSTKLVDANQKLKVEQTLAQQNLEVAEAELKNQLKAAEARFEAATKLAAATLIDGEADAGIIMAKNKAEVAGLKTAVTGFISPDQYAQFEVLKKVSPALSEIFASDNSEFAKVFTTYMTGPRKPAAPAPANGGERAATGAKPSGEK